jgi:hypothetical protein
MPKRIEVTRPKLSEENPEASEALKRWNRKAKKRIEAAKRSTELSAKDLGIIPRCA